jgi:hypothetical protein
VAGELGRVGTGCDMAFSVIHTIRNSRQDLVTQRSR